MKVLKSQMGMSLIEVMIAVSILSVIMVGVMTMGRNMDKNAKNAEKRGDIEGVMTQLQQALNNKDNCTATVMGAAAGVGVATPITSIKSIVNTGATVGAIESNPRLSVSSVSATDTRNQVIINGMYLVNRLNHAAGGNYDLIVTFVKNPAAARGKTMSESNTMVNYVTRKIPLSLDNCTRTLRWAVAPNTPTCTVGTPATAPITIYSSGASPDTAFNVIACRDCGTRTTVRGCN